VTLFRDLAAGHSYEESARSLDNLEVAYDKFFVDGDQAESAKAIFQIRNKFDADFGDVHGVQAIVGYCDGGAAGSRPLTV